MRVRTAAVKYMPFLNIEELGTNIQNEEMTKNKRANPKKIFKKTRYHWILPYASAAFHLRHKEVL